MTTTHLFALHPYMSHLNVSRGTFVLLVMLALVLLIAVGPSKSQTK